MFSKEFLAYRDKIPTAPPTSMEGPGQPGMAPPPGTGGTGAPIPPEFAHLKVPMMPPDYRSPEPEIPEGFAGGKVRFSPHITLIRRAEYKYEGEIPVYDAPKGRMKVESISLMRSDRGKHGMIYTEIGSVE